MIYITFNQLTGKAQLSNSTQAKALDYKGVECRHDWKTFERAEQVAVELTESEARLYIATDSGPNVSPRFDVIEAPRVGDEVSYAFNGDSTPCGTITKVSDSLRRIETSTGRVFYRRRQSGTWLSHKTWALVRGHVSARNPSF